jgi:mannose-6-phosphate isomerase-like protein (cupin superfamily)
MRIAILAPARKSAPDLFDQATALVEGLEQKDVAVELIDIEEFVNEKTAEGVACLAEQIDLAGHFDLVHNFAGTLPPALVRFCEAPMIVTLDGTETENDTLFLASCGEEVIFVANKSGLKIYGLTLRDTIAADAPDFVERYLALYLTVHDNTKREDHRPWGYYVILSDEPDHKVKRIVVYPGKRLSYQSHRRRAEHWYVVSGKALVTLNDQPVPLEAGQAVDIGLSDKHRVENPGDVDMVFIEVQTGDYFGEDDIERYEDDFGRS